MASIFTPMSSVSSLESPSTMKKKVTNPSESLSSFTSTSSNPLGQRRQNIVLQKRCSVKIKAMAKELHFNKDGSTIRKLQLNKLLDGLGPRYTDWPGCDPLPVDADLLPD